MSNVYVYDLAGRKVYTKEYGTGAVLIDYRTNYEIADFYSHICLEKMLHIAIPVGWMEKNVK